MATSHPNCNSGSAYAYAIGGDCNVNGVADLCEIASGSSQDVNDNLMPDECESEMDSATVDNGETATLNPGGGSDDPTEEALVDFTNVSGPDGATVTVTETLEDLHPGAGGYAVFDTNTTLIIETSLNDGEFFMTVMMPFTFEDLGGGNPLKVDLAFYDPGSDTWMLAVAGNAVDSPGHPGPVGDQEVVEDTVIPSLSTDLGDYGVFWNPDTLMGFAWANVDHATDFAPGLWPCWCDCADPPDGIVNVIDFLAMLAQWGGPGTCDCDQPPDDVVNVIDFLALLGAWGPCP
jgi:hypothetical protein